MTVLVSQPAGLADPHADPMLASPAARWMVLWTKPRQEKAVARYLQAVAAEHYLPLMRHERRIGGRRRTAELPLFPGYVFLNGSLEAGYGAIETKRVCQVLEIPDQPQFIHEIEQIRSALACGAEVEPYPFAVAGRRCRVVCGPLQGIEGVITERLGPHCLILALGILGQGASLEIDIADLEPID